VAVEAQSSLARPAAASTTGNRSVRQQRGRHQGTGREEILRPPAQLADEQQSPRALSPYGEPALIIGQRADAGKRHHLKRVIAG